MNPHPPHGRSGPPAHDPDRVPPAQRVAELFAEPAEALVPPPAFDAACAEFGIALTDDERAQLGRYLALLFRANEAFNLTAIRDPEEAWTRHIFDSLTLLSAIAELPPDAPLCDVGSGGGLPGIPLAIVRPGAPTTLLEPTAKKAAFLEGVACALGLANVCVVSDRAERVGALKGPLRDAFPIVTARAVGRLNLLLELTVPLATVGGLVLAMKGQRAEEELAEAKPVLHLLHAAHLGTIQTPTGRIVVVEKRRATPKVYPRRDGEPKRRPLG